MALAISGCTNPTATNYNPLATIDDGSCIGGLTPGCCDPTATNFNPLATCDDGSCLYVGGGNTCLACGTTGSDDSVPGCCDIVADNYNSLATCDDGSCQYTFDSWECNECTTLTMCDGWNGIMGHLPLMSFSNNPTPRTDIGQIFTTDEEARIWYFDNPTVSHSTTYFTYMSSTPPVGQSYNSSTYFINGVDWTGGTKGILTWIQVNLHLLTNGQYGISAQAGPMTPFFGGMGGTATNIINWYMNEGFPVYQGMTWAQFKVEIENAGIPGHYWRLGINTQARCSDSPPMGCIQAPTVFTCEEAVGGSFATKQECIDDGCETV